ncbi:MAG: hypothetical protein H6733_12195 [Alphaproteobacteria bacterium]|nr:hypothetical protein [Alphaproteobacteria bacterium]
MGTTVGMLLVVAAFTSAMRIPDQGLAVLAVWVVAMIGPVVVVPALAARAVALLTAVRDGRAQIADLEARTGALVGRTGTVRHQRVTGDGFPIPDGGRRSWFHDADDPTLRLPVLDGDDLAHGAAVRVTGAEALRAGQVAYLDRGVAVRVAPVQG